MYDSYFRVRPNLLKSVTGITKCDDYYNVRRGSSVDYA